MANKNVIGFSMGLVAGSTLLKVGLCQQKLGALEREFAASASQVFGDPLKKFLESDLKVILNPNLKKIVGKFMFQRIIWLKLQSLIFIYTKHCYYDSLN